MNTPKAERDGRSRTIRRSTMQRRRSSTTSLCGSRFESSALYFGSFRCAQPLPRGFAGAKKIDSWRVVAEQLHRQKKENKQRSTCNSGSAGKKLRHQA